jgi:hypothetical protein
LILCLHARFFFSILGFFSSSLIVG